jgi:hypothetical protein
MIRRTADEREKTLSDRILQDGLVQSKFRQS